MASNWLTSAYGLPWTLCFTLLFCLIYRYVIKSWWYFNERNLKFVRGIPLLGSTYRSTLGLENIATNIKKVYDRFPNEHIIGMYNLGGGTSYMIRDPDLIKQVTITNFEHFVNHNFEFPESSEPLISGSLVILRDEKWRRMRATMSPAFTGCKMRLMHSLVVDTTKDFATSLENEIDEGSSEFDTKDLFHRFANDVIANCAFGIKTNSMASKDNEFYEYVQKLCNFDGFKGLMMAFKVVAYMVVPRVMIFFKIRILDKEEANFFRSIIMNNINQRIESKIVRNDMIDLLIKARDGSLSHLHDPEEKDDGIAITTETEIGKSTEAQSLRAWTDDEMVAQCFIFLLAGFETVSLAFCFLLHELAVNPEIQARVFNEISWLQKELQGCELDYSSLIKLKYMDMVISESLRRWATSFAIERQVNKPIVLENSDGTKVKLNPKDSIFIPTYALQMDDKYFPNPEKFDPERFSDENKDKIKPGTFIPFGMGPRGCIASRFALMELKTNLFYLLSNFVVEKCAKTQDPLVLRNSPQSMDGEKGFWVKISRRNQGQK